MCTCISHNPGIRNFPRASITRASLGTRSVPDGPIAVIRPAEITTVWSACAGRPEASITVTCVSARMPALCAAPLVPTPSSSTATINTPKAAFIFASIPKAAPSGAAQYHRRPASRLASTSNSSESAPLPVKYLHANLQVEDMALKKPKSITHNGKRLSDILDAHERFFRGKGDGEQADLAGADLSHADLQGVNLSGAILRHANLESSDLRRAKLPHADFSGANLHDADMGIAILRETDLSGADLSGVDLSTTLLPRGYAAKKSA